MKIKSLTLRNYKKYIEEKTFFFTDNGKSNAQINEITLLIGNNGTGKSSILQAIDMLIRGTALPFTLPGQSDYPGFQYQHIQAGKLPIKIEARIAFSPDEIAATLEYAKRLQEMKPDKNLETPAAESEITLKLDYEANKIISTTSKRLYQAKGYQYALQLYPFTQTPQALLDRVGAIYTYTEQRVSASIFQINFQENIPVPIKATEEKFRDTLISWARYDQDIRTGRTQLREGRANKYQRLCELFSSVFPGRSLAGPAPKNFPDATGSEDFFLFDGKAEYEIGSMSGAERAIFPILMDFANWNINNSIILIDEIELHLHPPLQQAIVRMLPKLGKNNQFIITTHSDSVAVMFNRSNTIRLK